MTWNKCHGLLAGLAVCLSALSAHPAAAQGYTVTDVGPLGAGASTVVAINNRGQILGSQYFVGGYLQTGADILSFGGPQTFPNGLNDGGLIVGRSISPDNSTHAWLYAGGTMRDLGSLGGSYSSANTINNLGQIVGCFQTAAGYLHACLFTPDGPVDLGTLAGGNSAAMAINNLGQAVGWADVPGGLQYPCVFSDGQITNLGWATGQTGTATTINDKGQIAGWYSLIGEGMQHAFVYSDGQMKDISVHASAARAINASGQVVGKDSEPTIYGYAIDSAFVWDSQNGLRNLNSLISPAAGAALEDAAGITDSGQIVVNPQGGGMQSLLLTPIRPHLVWRPQNPFSWKTSVWSLSATSGLSVRDYALGGFDCIDSAVGGTDGLQRLLFSNLYKGEASLWTLHADGTFDHQEYGPYDGWKPIKITVGTDNRVRLLWERTDGKVSLWTINGPGSFDYDDYGPYPGWSVRAMSMGPDNKPRLLWTNSDANQQMSLWTITGPGQFQLRNYGPYGGPSDQWQATGMAVGGDGQARVMWCNEATGQLSLWTVASDGSFTFDDYGPFPSWNPSMLAVGYDNHPRVLWQNQEGRVSLWDIYKPGQFTYEDYGPFPGWSPVAITPGIE